MIRRAHRAPAASLFGEESLFGLGDLYCTRAEAETGIAQVQRLVTFWNRWREDRRAGTYASSVESVLRRFQSLGERLAATRTPAAGEWCEMKQLGAEADVITGNLSAAVGQAAPPKITSSEGWLDKLLGVVSTVAVLLGAGLVVRTLTRSSAHDG